VKVLQQHLLQLF
ncbi:hypothetical protein D031_4265B, partial [Vibrio parahaemolyticus VP-48]